MDTSLMKRMKELEQENARLKKMYAEEKLKAEIVAEALEKNGKAIATQSDGRRRGKEQGRDGATGLPGF
jgi:phage regulator Rha-like protein